MATSSIFTHVVIDTDEKASLFLNAMEKAEQFPKDRYLEKPVSPAPVSSDSVKQRFQRWKELHPECL